MLPGAIITIMFSLTHWRLVTPWTLFNFGSDNGLVPDGTKPLPEPIFTYHWWSHMAFTWGSFTWNVQDLSHHNLYTKLHIWNYRHISQGTMSSNKIVTAAREMINSRIFFKNNVCNICIYIWSISFWGPVSLIITCCRFGHSSKENNYSSVGNITRKPIISPLSTSLVVMVTLAAWLFSNRFPLTTRDMKWYSVSVKWWQVKWMNLWETGLSFTKQ